MSSFYQPTVHPRSGKIAEALWIDDYFGSHRYGVRFPGESRVFSEDECDIESTDEVAGSGGPVVG